MKIRNLLLIAILGLSGAIPSLAQLAGGGGRLSFLSAEDRRHLLRVRRQVVSENPDLKTEGESLKKEREFVKGQGSKATSQDRETLRNNLLAHGEKMEAAMLKDDPSVGPILDQVKAHMKERFEQRAGQNSGGTASPGAGSTTNSDDDSGSSE